MLEIGFCDEANAGGRASVDVCIVNSHAVGGPIRHAVVDILAVVDGHGSDVVLTQTDVRARIDASATAAPLDSEVEELLRAGLPRRSLSETRDLVPVPFPCPLLGPNVEVVSVCVKGIDLI